MPDPVPVPKTIHVIHAGGGPLKPERREYVASFRRHNPDWNIWLWWDPERLLVDVRNQKVKEKYGKDVGGKIKVKPDVWKKVRAATGDGTDEETLGYLKKKFKMSSEELSDIMGNTYEAMRDFTRSNQIVLKHIGQVFQHVPAMAYTLYSMEMGGNPVSGTNYGASSDILRVAILGRFGGLYVDTDIVCLTPLGDITARPKHGRFALGNHPAFIGLHATGCTAAEWIDDAYWRRAGFLTGTVPRLSNSIIACHPGSAGLDRYMSVIMGNYASKMANPKQFVNEYVNDFRNETIRLTGPTAAATAVEQAKPAVRGHMDTLRNSLDDAQKIAALRYVRDNFIFPMYMVKDVYGHDWLKN